MKTSVLLISVAVASLFAAAPALADIQATPSNMQGWSSPPTENSGGGSAAITATPYDGDGSVAVTGDRSRFVLGGLAGLYGDPTAPGATNVLGNIGKFTDTSFSYMVDPSSSSGTHDPKYSPALRVVFWNGGVKDELVFEQAYQLGGYSSAAPIGTWNVTSSDSLFYLKSLGNENNAKTIADWTTNFGVTGMVGGLYVGVGSSASSSYLAHVDNIIAGGNTYKFDMTGGAVPEPATWGLMILGFGGVGATLRRRRATGLPAAA